MNIKVTCPICLHQFDYEFKNEVEEKIGVDIHCPFPDCGLYANGSFHRTIIWINAKDKEPGKLPGILLLVKRLP